MNAYAKETARIEAEAKRIRETREQMLRDLRALDAAK